MLGIAIGMTVLVFTKVRVGITPYRSMHQWLRDHGVPAPVRNLDSDMLLILAAVLGA